MATNWADFDMYAAVVAAKTAKDRLMPVLKAINAAGKTHKQRQLEDGDFTKEDRDLKQLVADRIPSEAAKNKVGLTGFAGESAFDVYRALMK